MKLYLVRHGQTDWNIHWKIQGRSDIPLNDTGRKQAHITGEKSKNIKIDRIIASPLVRAYETAQIINEYHHVPLSVDNRLMERDFGIFEGRYKEDFNFEEFWDYDLNKSYEASEDVHSFFTRIYDYLDELNKTYPEESIMIVAHGGVSIPVYCYYHKGDKIENYTKLIMKNSEVVLYENTLNKKV